MNKPEIEYDLPDNKDSTAGHIFWRKRMFVTRRINPSNVCAADFRYHNNGHHEHRGEELLFEVQAISNINYRFNKGIWAKFEPMRVFGHPTVKQHITRAYVKLLQTKRQYTQTIKNLFA